MKRISIVFGTRPEAIKLCPIILAMRRHEGLAPHVCVTAQHREMLDQVLEVFEVVPDVDLNLMRPDQTLSALTARILEGVDAYLKQCKPDLMLVQGDTATVLAASLEGMPSNAEPHVRDIFGRPLGGGRGFQQGDYSGTLPEVKRNVRRFGHIEVCRFMKGWFKDTMPRFKEPCAAIYLDVDLVASTRTCVKHLWPLLSIGGCLFSHDGHLPLVVDLFNDDRFWATEVGCKKPQIDGLGQRKLITIIKDSGAKCQQSSPPQVVVR